MSVAAPPVAQPCTIRHPAWITAGVGLLLALYLIMTLSASLQKGPSFDEEEQLAVGYNIWLHHDFRMEGADGDLIKRWATLPYLITRPKPASTENDYWRNARPYRFGFEFLFESGNAPEWLLLQGRIMVALLGAATALLVFCCTKELFGTVGGFFSLIVFVFSPHMLAFGGMVSTDMSVCFTLLGATWSVWRLLHVVTWRRLFLSLAFVSLLMLSKPSALVIFPITLILVLIKLLSRRPVEWHLRRSTVIASPLKQIGLIAGLFVLHGLCAWAVLWAHYDFRFLASPNPADPGLIFTHYDYADPVEPQVAVFMNWLRGGHWLPEGFLQGIHDLLVTNESRTAFMDGQWKIGGWNSFFLHALWDKTSPALLAMTIIGLISWWCTRLFPAHSTQTVENGRLSAGKSPPSFYEGAPYFVLIGVYYTIAAWQEVNIGHRHILPIYPALYILSVGSFSLVWSQARRWSWLLLTGLLVFQPLESLLLYPDYLAYFSPFVGGPAKGYKHLVDSSLDWGMDLPGVKKWLDQNNPKGRDPVFLAYFGTDSPEYYGIKSLRLPGDPEWRPPQIYPYAPGIYIISATLFESDYTYTFGPWNTFYEKDYQNTFSILHTYEITSKDPIQHAALLKTHPEPFWINAYSEFEKLRFGRLCAWLRHYRPVPDASCGYAILIWRLSAKDLEDALLGPPAEIDDSPSFKFMQ